MSAWYQKLEPHHWAGPLKRLPLTDELTPEMAAAYGVCRRCQEPAPCRNINCEPVRLDTTRDWIGD